MVLKLAVRCQAAQIAGSRQGSAGEEEEDEVALKPKSSRRRFLRLRSRGGTSGVDEVVVSVWVELELPIEGDACEEVGLPRASEEETSLVLVLIMIGGRGDE